MEKSLDLRPYGIDYTLTPTEESYAFCVTEAPIQDVINIKKKNVGLGNLITECTFKSWNDSQKTYTGVSFIQEGGYGVTSKMIYNDKYYVVKEIFLIDGNEVEHFLQEILINILLYKADPRFVPRIYDVGLGGNYGYIVMELLDATLKDLIKNSSPNLNDIQVPICFIQLNDMLNIYKQKLSFAHRDFHLGNVMYIKGKEVVCNGKQIMLPKFKIIDFGYSCIKWNGLEIKTVPGFYERCQIDGRNLAFLMYAIIRDVDIEKSFSPRLLNLLKPYMNIYSKGEYVDLSIIHKKIKDVDQRTRHVQFDLLDSPTLRVPISSETFSDEMYSFLKSSLAECDKGVLDTIKSLRSDVTSKENVLKFLKAQTNAKKEIEDDTAAREAKRQAAAEASRQFLLQQQKVKENAEKAAAQEKAKKEEIRKFFEAQAKAQANMEKAKADAEKAAAQEKAKKEATRKFFEAQAKAQANMEKAKADAEKATAEKAAVEKAAVEKAAAAAAAAQKAVAEKEAAEKAAQKAAAETAAAEKAAAEKAAADIKAAEEKAKAEESSRKFFEANQKFKKNRENAARAQAAQAKKAAAEKEAEKKAAAAEKAKVEKVLTEKIAVAKAEAEKDANEKVAAEKVAAAEATRKFFEAQEKAHAAIKAREEAEKTISTIRIKTLEAEKRAKAAENAKVKAEQNAAKARENAVKAQKNLERERQYSTLFKNLPTSASISRSVKAKAAEARTEGRTESRAEANALAEKEQIEQELVNSVYLSSRLETTNQTIAELEEAVEATQKRIAILVEDIEQRRKLIEESNLPTQAAFVMLNHREEILKQQKDMLKRQIIRLNKLFAERATAEKVSLARKKAEENTKAEQELVLAEENAFRERVKLKYAELDKIKADKAIAKKEENKVSANKIAANKASLIFLGQYSKEPAQRVQKHNEKSNYTKNKKANVGLLPSNRTKINVPKLNAKGVAERDRYLRMYGAIPMKNSTLTNVKEVKSDKFKVGDVVRCIINDIPSTEDIFEVTEVSPSFNPNYVSDQSLLKGNRLGDGKFVVRHQKSCSVISRPVVSKVIAKPKVTRRNNKPSKPSRVNLKNLHIPPFPRPIPPPPPRSIPPPPPRPIPPPPPRPIPSPPLRSIPPLIPTPFPVEQIRPVLESESLLAKAERLLQNSKDLLLDKQALNQNTSSSQEMVPQTLPFSSTSRHALNGSAAVAAEGALYRATPESILPAPRSPVKLPFVGTFNENKVPFQTKTNSIKSNDLPTLTPVKLPFVGTFNESKVPFQTKTNSIKSNRLPTLTPAAEKAYIRMLIDALKYNNTERLSELLKIRGNYKNFKDEDGNTPFMLTIKQDKSPEIIALFLNDPDIILDITNKDGKKAFDLAIDNKLFAVAAAIQQKIMAKSYGYTNIPVSPFGLKRSLVRNIKISEMAREIDDNIKDRDDVVSAKPAFIPAAIPEQSIKPSWLSWLTTKKTRSSKPRRRRHTFRRR